MNPDCMRAICICICRRWSPSNRASCTCDWLDPILSVPHLALHSSAVHHNYSSACFWSPRNNHAVTINPLTVRMAPIVVAVRSALLYAEPSHDTRASSAATPPSLLIGIPVFIVAVVLAIGTICWVLREKKAAKRVKEGRLVENVKPPEIDTTFAGTEVKYRRISELPGSEVAPSEHFESPQSTSYPATPLFEREDSDSLGYLHPRVPKPFQKAVQLQGHNLIWGDIERSPVSRISGPQIRDTSTAAARSDSSKEKECGTPQQVFPYIKRSLLELPGVFDSCRF